MFSVSAIDHRAAKLLVLIMTLLGGQSRAFFEQISAWTGYSIKIGEWSPFMCGVSEVGDTRYEYDNTGYYRWYLGPPENRFYWYLRSEEATLEWFRCGAIYSQCGIHPHLKIYLDSPMDCLLRRWQPAHVRMVFDYTNIGTNDPMAGTP